MSISLSLAAAVNEPETLAACLSLSSDIASGRLKLSTFEGYRTAGLAYNAALDSSDADVVIFAHQDVYLPRGFADRVVEQLAKLPEDWAVAGVIGANEKGEIAGHLWCTGNDCEIGPGLAVPSRVSTLDEVLIMVRRSSGVRFDEALPSFHLYGTDIIMIAEAMGGTCWAIEAPIVHRSKRVTNLGDGYAKAWNYMRRKWADRLPLPNLVCPITRSPTTLWAKDFRIRLRNGWSKERPDIAADPVAIARRMGFE
jgi:hypothetical protein